METRALLHLTCLRSLTLLKNPIRDPMRADWLLHFPSSVEYLYMRGDGPMQESHAAPTGWVQPIRSVPRISGLDRISRISFESLTGFHLSEWDNMSCFTRLGKLSSLSMSACGLEILPNAIVGLPSLRRLFLRGNKLDRMPMGPYLHKLEKLVIRDNNFSSVPMEVVGAATALTCLSMGANPVAWTAAEVEFVKRIKTFTFHEQEYIWDIM